MDEATRSHPSRDLFVPNLLDLLVAGLTAPPSPEALAAARDAGIDD
jgi:hypothetical protein